MPEEARFTFDELLLATGGHCVTGVTGLTETTGRGEEQARSSYRVATDTRTLAAGDFFLPIVGEQFNGHDFIPQAFAAGVSGAFAETRQVSGHPEWQAYPRLISVADTREAYLGLGRAHRRRMHARVIALTGSSGKTTTKDMLSAALCPLAPTQCTEKNYNNEIGVSRTLLSLQPETRLLIVEMGMRGLGEIALLSKAAEPDLALVINVGPAHIGRLGSLENIARAKCEIFEGLSPETGIAVVNGDDPLLLETATCEWSAKGARRPLETYSRIEAENRRILDSGETVFSYQGHEIRLSVPGDHMVSNALAVLKAGELLGYPVAEMARGLVGFVPAEGRWKRSPLAGFPEVWVINDAYNANPASMKASLQAFLEQPAPGLKRILVLGGMKELGDEAHHYHETLGLWLKDFLETLSTRSPDLGVDALVTVGEEGPWIAHGLGAQTQFPVIRLGEQRADLSAADSAGMGEILIESLAGAGVSMERCLIFLKGSRAYRLETLMDALSGQGHHRPSEYPGC